MGVLVFSRLPYVVVTVFLSSVSRLSVYFLLCFSAHFLSAAVSSVSSVHLLVLTGCACVWCDFPASLVPVLVLLSCHLLCQICLLLCHLLSDQVEL